MKPGLEGTSELFLEQQFGVLGDRNHIIGHTSQPGIVKSEAVVGVQANMK